MNILAAAGLTLLLAFVTESMVEYLFGQVFDHVPAIKPYSWLLMYIAAIVGVGLALFYQIDLVQALAYQAGLYIAVSWVGMVITGLVIGRGANYASQFVSKYLTKTDWLRINSAVIDDDEPDAE